MKSLPLQSAAAAVREFPRAKLVHQHKIILSICIFAFSLPTCCFSPPRRDLSYNNFKGSIPLEFTTLTGVSSLWVTLSVQGMGGMRCYAGDESLCMLLSPPDPPLLHPSRLAIENVTSCQLAVHQTFRISCFVGQAALQQLPLGRSG